MTTHPEPDDVELIDRLEALVSDAGALMGALKCGPGLATASDADVVRVLAAAGSIARHLEGVLVEAVDQAATRSAPQSDDPLTTRYGCHDLSELVQRTTLAAPATVARWRRAAKAIHRETSMVSGELLDAVLPELRQAMVDGHVGADGLLAAAKPLADLARRVDRGPLLAADAALAASARGEGSEGPVSACADLLRVQATVWAAVLDPDGSEPRDRVALHRRGITLGAPVDGLVPIHGRLMAEVAAQLRRICDAVSSPRAAGDTGGVRFVPEEHAPDTLLPPDAPHTDGNGPLDDRRAAQKRHDALATALFAAAASESLPTIGGAAPTLVVSVRQQDLGAGRGWAHSDDCDEPLSLRAAEVAACAGVIQRVLLDVDGRIVRLGTEERVFNKHQRRAIALRDGGCIIPGCAVPAAWCEIHHVDEHARGGPTHTDNGVLICWHHHRSLDRSGWAIRMRHGVPELRAPSWHDPTGRWRHVTKSPNRLKTAVRLRT